MKKGKWDSELKMRLESAITDSCGTKEAVKTCLAYIEKDRKHQKEELMKRLHDIVDLTVVLNKFRCEKTKYFWTPREVAEAVCISIKEKLEL